MTLLRSAVFAAALATAVSSNDLAASATILMSEDFESYAPETELMDDVPGWFRRPGSNPTGVLYVREGRGLGSQVADGYTNPGFATQVEAMHALNPPANVTKIVLSLDAYAFSFNSVSGVRSHNFTAYLTNSDNSVVFGWTFLTGGDENCSCGYLFGGTTLGIPTSAKCFNEPNAVDAPIHLEVLIDIVNATVQGRIDHSGPAPFETAVFSVAPALLADLGYFYSYSAYQGDHDYNGGELDNILVTAEIVEPESIILMVFGLIGLGFAGCRRAERPAVR